MFRDFYHRWVFRLFIFDSNKIEPSYTYSRTYRDGNDTTFAYHSDIELTVWKSCAWKKWSDIVGFQTIFGYSISRKKLFQCCYVKNSKNPHNKNHNWNPFCDERYFSAMTCLSWILCSHCSVKIFSWTFGLNIRLSSNFKVWTSNYPEDLI